MVLLYTNDPDAHYTYIERAKAKGYDVLLQDGELDVHCMSQAEQKHEKLRFVRIDSDTIENLIKKENTAKDEYSDEQKEGLRKAFEALLPSAEDKLRYFVTCEAAASDALPVFLTQNEFMRRMKEMSAHQQGMSFYGQMPDQYNLVINTAHPLIQELVGKEVSEEVQEEVQSDKGQSTKEGEEAPKETVIKTVYTLSGEDERLKQLIDIALLASGRLKGEALAKFVNRSVEML
jgi:molecular chaperone HtpG